MSAAPQVFVDAQYVYFGSSFLDGSWRSGTDPVTGDLVWERRESGTWVNKGSFPAI